MPATPAATCQHCDRPVEFGRTEQGFAGFVHTATGLAACPPKESTR